jgi:AraC family transcriptional regulator
MNTGFVGGARRRTLYVGETLTISDVHARPVRTGIEVLEPHPQHRLCLPLKGLFLRHLGANAQVVATPSHSLIVRADEPFDISYPRGGFDHCLMLRWPAELFEAPILSRGGGPRAQIEEIHPVLAPKLLLERSLLWRTVTTSGADPLEIEDRASQLIAALLTLTMRHTRKAGSSRARIKRRRQVEQVKELVGLMPHGAWTLAELAHHVHLSPFHLARVFRAEVGTSIHEYVLRTRLAGSLDRVLDPSTDLAALAMDVGFSSHSHFTSRFRATFGVAPSYLRGASIRHLASVRMTAES